MLRRVLDASVEASAIADVDDAWVIGDPVHVEQIVLNLAINARDAMPAGGSLMIRVGRVDTRVSLMVEDTGAGIDRGTGLGLATAFGIVEQMGGTVDVTSMPRQGSTLRLYFPAADAPDSEIGRAHV